MAESIAAQLAAPALRGLIERLRAKGLRFEEEGPAPGEGPLAGRTFVLTGTLPTLTREQAASGSLLPAGASRAPFPRTPTISWPVNRPARSSRRPSGSV